MDVLASGEVSISLTIEDRSAWILSCAISLTSVRCGSRTSGHRGNRWHRIAEHTGARCPGVQCGLAANVEIISQGASAINMTSWCGKRTVGVVRRRHREFFGSTIGLSMKIAIVGNGKMGKAVAALAAERGHSIHTLVTRLENVGGSALTAERLAGADVAIEFTRPDAAVANLERLISLGIPTVTGTTGWTESLPQLSELVRERAGALLHAANFSVGVHLFFRAARDLARSFRGRPEFAVSIHEEHHKTRSMPLRERHSCCSAALEEEPGAGFHYLGARRRAPGTHALTYSAPHETVTLNHVTGAGSVRRRRARGRRVAARAYRGLYLRSVVLESRMTRFQAAVQRWSPFTESGQVDFAALQRWWTGRSPRGSTS